MLYFFVDFTISVYNISNEQKILKTKNKAWLVLMRDARPKMNSGEQLTDEVVAVSELIKKFLH